jgi:hypothetical protein
MGMFVLGFALTHGERFLSRPESCPKRSAEIIILLSIIANHKIFVSFVGTVNLSNDMIDASDGAAYLFVS